MAVDATMPTTIKSAPSSSSSSSSSSSTSSTATTGIADNFQTFLTLLTTQLQNQNPLDPLDTNQFTAQLVQFAGVEQQLRQNDQLATLVSLEKSAQSTQALGYVGYTVSVDGSKAPYDGTNSAAWTLNAPNDTTAAITITNSAGQTVFSGNYPVTKGKANFTWDGKGNDGTQYPAGYYTINASGSDLQRLTPVSGEACGPTWSPNGKRIAFTNDNGGRWLITSGIYLMNTDGRNIFHLKGTAGACGITWQHTPA